MVIGLVILTGGFFLDRTTRERSLDLLSFFRTVKEASGAEMKLATKRIERVEE